MVNTMLRETEYLSDLHVAQY